MGRPKKVQNTADYSAEMQQEAPAAKKANVPDEKVSAMRSEISSLEASLADTQHLRCRRPPPPKSPPSD